VTPPPLGETHDQVGAENLAAMGGGDQAGGLHDGQAAHIPIQPAHVARAERGADGNGGDRLVIFAADRLLDRHGRVERDGGGFEQGHEPIAEALDEHRPVRDRDRAQQLVVAPEMLISEFFAEAGPRARRADHVGEQHRDRGQCAGLAGRHDAPWCRGGL
jgi:hypothetical protein